MNLLRGPLDRARMIGVGALVFLGAFTCVLAQAAQPSSTFSHHDSNAPVDVIAGQLQVQSRADRAVFVGDVIARQGDMILKTPRLTVAYATVGSFEINRLDASGGVVISDPSGEASADLGIYDLDRRLITLIGNVHLKRGQSEASGSRLVIDVTTGNAYMSGAARAPIGGTRQVTAHLAPSGR